MFCALDRSSNRTVAPSGAQALNQRRKPSSTSTSSSSDTFKDRDSAKVRRASSRSQIVLPFWQQDWFLVLLFGMAMGLFALSVILYFGLSADQSSASSASASSSSEGVEVCCLFVSFMLNFIS